MLEHTYRQLLKLGPFTANKKGKIMVDLGLGDPTAFKIDEKELWLPTKYALKHMNAKKEIFNPLKENLMSGPPGSLIAYRNILLQSFNTIYFPYFIHNLVEATKLEDTGKSVKLQSVLTRYPTLSSTDVTNIEHMVTEHKVIDIDLKHNTRGEVTSTLTSPLLEEVRSILSDKSNERMIGNKAVTNKSLKAMKTIIMTILDVKDSKESATQVFKAQGKIAKSSEVIITAFGSVLVDFIDDLNTFEGFMTGGPTLTIPSYEFLELEVFSSHKNLNKLIKSVSSNSTVASALKQKKKKSKTSLNDIFKADNKKQKKKRKKRKYRKIKENQYGIVNNQQSAFCNNNNGMGMEMDSELAALHNIGLLNQNNGQGQFGFNNNQQQGQFGFNNQQNNVWDNNQPTHDKFGLPIQQQQNQQFFSQPQQGKFGWT